MIHGSSVYQQWLEFILEFALFVKSTPTETHSVGVERFIKFLDFNLHFVDLLRYNIHIDLATTVG